MAKKLLYIISFSIMAIPFAGAQSYMLQTGLSIANVRSESGGTRIATYPVTGIHFGAFGQFRINDPLVLKTGFQLLKKGYKMDVLFIEVTIPVHYLNIPLNLIYQYDLGAIRIFAEAGPYGGIGLRGMVKYDAKKEKIEFGSGDGQLYDADWGMNFGAGFEFKSFQLSANYQLGLINIEGTRGTTTKHSVICISIGYLIERGTK